MRWLLLLLTATLSATELRPWFPPDKEIQWRSAYGRYLTESLEGSPTAGYDIELEVSTKRSKLTLRTSLLDDVVSVTPGISLISGCHRYGAELHLGIGKEVSCGKSWSSRWWAVPVVGIAKKGSPWVRFIGGWDWKRGFSHEGSIYTEMVAGHRSCIGMGATYFYHWSNIATFKIDYAHFFPAHNHRLTGTLLFSFGL